MGEYFVKQSSRTNSTSVGAPMTQTGLWVRLRVADHNIKQRSDEECDSQLMEWWQVRASQQWVDCLVSVGEWRWQLYTGKWRGACTHVSRTEIVIRERRRWRRGRWVAQEAGSGQGEEKMATELRWGVCGNTSSPESIAVKSPVLAGKLAYFTPLSRRPPVLVFSRKSPVL